MTGKTMAHGGDIYRNQVELDFSVNLNPLPIHKEVRKAMEEANQRISFYPDPEQAALRAALARHAGLGEECVFAGNGASELIMAAVRAFLPKKVLLIQPCYSGYRYALESLTGHGSAVKGFGFPGCRIDDFLLSERNGFVLTEEVLRRISPDTELIFLTDPWNPTGKNIDDDLLQKILQKASVSLATVLLDQSFLLLSEKGAGGCDLSGLLKQYENLVVIRSFTKFLGVPGIRMGAVFSSAEKIGRIRKNLPEWNLSAQAEAVMRSGIRIAEDKAYMDEVLTQIRAGRGILSEELRSLGCRVYDSDAAFLLFYA